MARRGTGSRSQPRLSFVIDMNLSPRWCGFLESHEFGAVHWSEIGDPQADDTEILNWARERDHVVFTNDLDFGRLLALTRGKGPSVIQTRTEDLLPDAIGPLVLRALQQHLEALAEGALVVIELDSLRVRLLPL